MNDRSRQRDVRSLACVILLIAWPRPLVMAAAPPYRPPTDAQFKEAAKWLDVKNDVPSKRKALKWLQSNLNAKNAGLVMPALAQTVRADPDADIRCGAIAALAWIAKYRKGPCPLAIVEALLDKEDGVHSYAGIAYEFRTFEPGSVEVLLRCARSEREIVRENALLLLQAAGGRDKKVLEVLEKAKQDKSFIVRNDAYLAMFKANDKLNDYLSWIIRVRQEFDGMPDPKLTERERNQRNLTVLLMEMKMIEWRDKRPEELSRALVKLLDDKSPPTRRQAAWLIGAVYRRNAAGLIIADIKLFQFETSNEKSACAPHLEKLKAAERLQKVSDDDPDGSVRAAARMALKQFKAAPDKD
jgi:HEAT repeat protein